MLNSDKSYVYDLGIVIVNYNVRHFLAQCINSIKNSHIHVLKTELWVVDNGSVDGSVALIENEYPEIHLIANVENKGFSAANNQAIRLMQSKYILLLNPDTVLEEDTLDKCFKFMEEHELAGALGVRMIDGAGKFLPESKRKIPDLWNSFCKLSYLSDIFPSSKWFSGYNLGYLPEKELNEVDVLSGAFMFIRSSALDKTGLLDEDFFMYGEDIDLCHRILNKGYKIFYFPETSIVHYKGESTKKGSINYIRTFYGAMIIYVKKHFSTGPATFFAQILRIAITFRALLSALFNGVKDIGHQFLDIVLIYLTLLVAKDIWALYYFGNLNYYAHTHIHVILFIYALVWVFFLWLVGHYDKKTFINQSITGIITGTAILLVVYALLPESLRISRALILIGVLTTLIISILTRMLFSTLKQTTKSSDTAKNIAIVANKTNALKLNGIIRINNPDISSVHFISPSINENDSFFSNSLINLATILRSLKINEIIYSSDDISFKEIIGSMSEIGSQASFKIGGDDSLSIIGSSDRNKQGELYSVDVHYNLADTEKLRYKRVFDIAASLIFIVLAPFLFILCGFRKSFFINIFAVLFGSKTWIGYGGKSSDFSFLPTLKKGIIKYPQSSKVLQYVPQFFKDCNTQYAKSYTLWTDMKVLLLNLHKLGNDSL